MGLNKHQAMHHPYFLTGHGLRRLQFFLRIDSTSPKQLVFFLALTGINTAIVGLRKVNLLTTLLGQYIAYIMFSQYFLNTDTVSSR